VVCSAYKQPTASPVNPLRGKTINWKAVCGKSASTVWGEGERFIASPYPINEDHRTVRVLAE
jgi:hypothetical protein